jgi:golgi phosphoprotein 3
MNPPLLLVEEIALLSLDDKTGAHLPLLPEALGYGLAGAILSDLEMAGRIATGTDAVSTLDPTPTGNPLLDPWLDRIASETTPHPPAYWLSVIADDKPAIEEAVLASLVQRGILRREDRRFLWVFGLRRYPTVDNMERTEVRTRLAALILGDDPPDHFDATLISLLGGCCLLQAIFQGREFEERAHRIEQISEADPVGREVAAASRQAIEALAMAQSIQAPQF